MIKHPVFYVVIATYFLLLIAVSVVIKRLNKNVDDYFRSGCRATWWLTGTSAFMSTFSAWTFTGAADLAFRSGWSAMLIFSGSVTAYLVNFVFLAAWFRQLRVITFPEVLEQRFGRITQQFYAWLIVFRQVFFGAVALYSVSVFLTVVFGLNLMAMIIIVGVITVTYAAIGGTWAVMSNGFLQALILIPITIAVAALNLWQIGGINGLFQAIHKAGLTDQFAVLKPGGFHTDLAWGWALALFLQAFIGDTSIGTATSYFKVKDGREARRSALLHAILLLGGVMLFFIPPIVARLLYSDTVATTGLARPGEAAYAVASIKVLPSSMVALVVVTMLSVTMSSLDNGLNANAGVVMRNILPPLRRRFGWKTLSDRKEVFISEAITCLLGGAIVALACHFAGAEGKGLFATMLDLTALLGVPLYVPLFMVVFVRNSPPWAAILSVAAGLTGSALGLFSHEFFGTVWSYQLKVVVNLSSGMGAYLLSTLFWRYSTSEYRTKVSSFYAQMRRPVDFAAEVGVVNDRVQFKIIGFFGAIIGLLICLLVLSEATVRGRWVISVVGGILLLIGLWFIALSRFPTSAVAAQIKTGNGRLPK